jgi:hypothetical protein
MALCGCAGEDFSRHTLQSASARFISLAAREPGPCHPGDASFQTASDHSIHLRLECEGGAVERFTLKPPATPDERASLFVVEADDVVSKMDQARVSRLLGRIFTRPPWEIPAAVTLRVEYLILTLLVLSFAGGLLFVVWCRPAPMPAMTSVPAAVAVGIASSVWLHHISPAVRAGVDQSIGLLLAQDCLRESVCHLEALGSGVQFWLNGAVWLHLLTAVGLFTMSASAIKLVLLVLSGCGVATIFISTWRWLRPAWALPAAIIATAALSFLGDLSAASMVDASAVFFPAAICTCALLVFVQSGHLAPLAIAAVFASHATNTHVAAAVLLPAVLLAAVIASPRPLAATALAGVLYLLTGLTTSATAVIQNLWGQFPGRAVGVLAGLAVLMLICAAARPRFAALGSTGRAGVLTVLVAGPVVAGYAVLSLHSAPTTSRYVAAAIPLGAVALSGLLVETLDALARRTVARAWVGAFLAPLLAVLSAARVPEPQVWMPTGDWTYEDGQRLAELLSSRGWCYARAARRIQSDECAAVADAVMPYACHDEIDHDGPELRQQMRVWLADTRQPLESPAGAETLVSGGTRKIVLSPIDSWLDLSAVDVCTTTHRPDGGESAPVCVRPAEDDGAPWLYSHRWSTGLSQSAQLKHVKLSIPIYPVAGQTHGITFPENPVNAGGGQGCVWKITGVEGLDAEPALPATAVRLTSISGSPGRIVVERMGPDGPCDINLHRVPCVWETRPEDPAWMRR